MSNLRNAQLLKQMESNPLRSSLAKILDLAEEFKDAIEAVSDNRDLSIEGRQKAMQGHLRRAVRDLRDAKTPLNEMQKKLEQKRAAVAMPPFDKNDTIGFLRRQELRSVLRSMNAEQRAMHLNDPSFADAMLETAPLVSGLFLAEDFKGTISPEIQRDRDIVAAAKEKRLAGMFGPQLEEIAELEKTLAEANMIADLARNDLQHNSAMDDRQFTEFVRSIRRNAVWLKWDKDFDGNERIIVIDLANPEGPVGKPATADQIRDGVFFKDFAEYQASRSAA
jgi:hypothetical protein